MQSMLQEISEYLVVCQYQRKLNEKTVKMYRIDLLQFQDYLDQRGMELVRESIAQYVMHMNKKYRPRSVRRKVASLRAFCRYLEEEDKISVNPFVKLRISTKVPMILPRTIPLRIIEQLLSASYRQIEEGKTPYQRKCALRDTAVMELLFATGVRVSELCRLRLRDVDLPEGKLKIYQSILGTFLL